MPSIRMLLMIALFVVGIALNALWLCPPPEVLAVNGRHPPVVRIPQPAAQQTATSVITLPVAREAESLNSPDRSASDDLAILSLLLSSYRRHNDGNPVGANEEIAAALLGHNHPGVAYLPAKGSLLDGQGQLVDRWGTPYFFHALAHDRMDIRSAGPDHVFWTADDLIHHPGD